MPIRIGIPSSLSLSFRISRCSYPSPLTKYWLVYFSYVKVKELSYNTALFIAYSNYLKYLFEVISKGAVKTGVGISNTGSLKLSDPTVKVSPAAVSEKPVKAMISPVPIEFRGKYWLDLTLSI